MCASATVCADFKVFEHLLSVHLRLFMECSGVLPTTQFAHRKGLGTAMHFCACHIHHKVALDSGQEAMIVQIDFSAAFDRVNQQGILYKICSLGIGGSVLSMLTQFLSNRAQHVMVDGCWSKLINVMSGMLQLTVWGLLFYLLYTSELFSILENKPIGYVDDFTLIAVVPSPSIRVTISCHLQALGLQ